MSFSFNKVCSNVIPAGTYKVIVTDIKFKTSSTGESSNDMQVFLTIAEGDHAKRTLIDTIYEKAFSWRLKPFLTACGIDMNREFSTAKELYEYGIRAAKGKTILAEITVRPYNGVDYNNVKDYAPLPGSTTSVDDVLNEFDINVAPSKPRLDDIPDLTEDVESPIAEVSEDDLPF